MKRFLTIISRVANWRDGDGHNLVEYGLILGLIAVIATATLNATGTNVKQLGAAGAESTPATPAATNP